MKNHELPGPPRKKRLKPRQTKLLLLTIALDLLIQIPMSLLAKYGIDIPYAVECILALLQFIPMVLFFFSLAKDTDFSGAVRFFSAILILLIIFAFCSSLFISTAFNS
ncbi:MAG: hypothetical protein IJ466_04235 [Clostridia bacterium]|nr:hypothetical protein [Clostridia bacterium]